MMQWLKKERCRICSDERSVRYCLRHNKELGWKCCNSYRADGKCPDTCPYSPIKDVTNSLLPKIKSDSRTEFMDYLEHYLQSWIYLPVTDLNNQTPNELSLNETGKVALTDWLCGFSFPDSGILNLLNKKLNLKLEIQEEANPNIETLASSYFDAVISHDWDAVACFHIADFDCSADTISYYTKLLMNHPMLKKVRHVTIINSGFTQDLKQAFVFCELNGKENWTFIFVNNAGYWQFYQSIWGTLQDYYEQKTQFRQIAIAISNKDESAIFNLLDSVKNKYPLSADIQYYYGLYYGLVKRWDDAKSAFTGALALEPNWQEPMFQLAFIFMSQKDYTTAITHLEKLNLLNPENANIMNNIGVCYLGLEQTDKAQSAWEQALRLDPNSEIAKKNLEHLRNG